MIDITVYISFNKYELKQILGRALEQYNIAAYDSVLSEWENDISERILDLAADHIAAYGKHGYSKIKGEYAQRISDLVNEKFKD